MLIRTGCILVISQFLITIATATSHVPSHFRNYPIQTGYDVQNPYSYPLRNNDIPPCSNVSPMFDKTNSTVGVIPPIQSEPPSSISYVPVQVPSSDVPQKTNIQRQLPVTNQRPIISSPAYPQMNGHLAAQQRLQATQYATHDSSRPVISQPTYNAEMQVEIQRQQQLMAAQLAENQRQKWQTSLPSAIPASTTASPHPTPMPIATTQSSQFLTPKSDFHALSQLSPEDLAAYANRLRSQFQQEKQQGSTQSTNPIPNPNLPNPSNQKFENKNLSPTNFVTQIPNLPASNLAIQNNVGSISSGGIRGKVNTASPSTPNIPLPVASNVENVNKTSAQLPVHPENGIPPNFTFPQSMLPVPFQPAPKLTHEINYCDRRQFDDEKLAELHLKRSDYFIYNTSCAGIFFQCAIGQTFVLKCPSVEGQAFDPAISSCNFKNSVRFCPEYDHVLHCTIRETCTPNEFACCALPQQCIEYSRRCDASCARNEFACVKSGKCIPAKLRCDGKPDDCGDGSNLDEIGCSKNETCLGKFVCDSPQTLALMKHSVCIDVDKFCDSKKDCPGGEDELDCRSSEATKYLSCENQKQQVRKNQWCDGRDDCLDGSDEKYCF